MLHATIGLIVGLIMGLTGAGGALISIPLFLNLLNTSLKEATVLSLVAVIFGTAANLLGVLKQVDRKIILFFVGFGAIANYLSLPLKAIIPELGIAALLTLIGIYSVWGVWGKPKQQQNINVPPHPIKMALTGLLLGLITTLTGLGGGVLLVPVLIQVFGKTYQEALPTSLATILLISGISFLLQLQTGMGLISIYELGLLAAGAAAAFFCLKLLLKKLNPEAVNKLRQIVFTLVAIYSITTVLISSLKG
jgi:uncharacterized protein